jgi:hypothetical protein
MPKITTLSDFMLRYRLAERGLHVELCSIHHEGEIRGPSGKITKDSCPCGGCFSVLAVHGSWSYDDLLVSGIDFTGDDPNAEYVDNDDDGPVDALPAPAPSDVSRPTLGGRPVWRAMG